MPRGLRILGNVLLVAGSVVGTFVLIECILQQTQFRSVLAGSTEPSDYYVSDPLLKYDIRPNVATTTDGFSEHPYQIWSNAQGCFDMPYTGETPYIYLTGDSYTWGFTPFQDKWGTEMQQLLSMRVLKCGVGGYGTLQEYIKTSRDLASLPSPELIVVGYYLNDASDDEQLAEWYAKGSGSQCPRVAQGREPIYLPCSLWQNWLGTHSILYNAALSLVVNTLTNRQPPEAPAVVIENFEHIEMFDQLAKRENARLLVVLIPPQSPKELGYSPYRSLEAFLQKQNISYEDLAVELKGAEATSSPTFYWQHDAHLNIAGNQVVGLLVSRYILEHGLISVNNRSSSTTLAAIDSELKAFGI